MALYIDKNVYVGDTGVQLGEIANKAPKSHASSGTTYGVGTASNYGHCRVINNLTTASATNGYALQAYQGKVLKDLINALTTKLNSIGTGIRVYNSNTQNILSKAFTTLVFNTVDYKTNNNLTLTSNKIKIGAGINYVLVNVRWTAWSSDTNGRYVYIYKNNDDSQYAFENSSYTGTMQTSCIVPVAEGDYIYASCYQESSGTITTSSTKTQTFMEVTVLG